MTEQIKQSVVAIKAKFEGLVASLRLEREKASLLSNEVAQLKILIKSQEDKNKVLEDENKSLSAKILQIQEEMSQRVESKTPSREAEIDDLVREIDQCIRHLKSSHE